MPPEGSTRVVVDGEVEDAKAAGLGANHGVSAAHLFTRCDDVLDSVLLHLLPWMISILTTTKTCSQPHTNMAKAKFRIETRRDHLCSETKHSKT